MDSARPAAVRRSNATSKAALKVQGSFVNSCRETGLRPLPSFGWTGFYVTFRFGLRNKGCCSLRRRADTVFAHRSLETMLREDIRENLSARPESLWQGSKAGLK